MVEGLLPSASKPIGELLQIGAVNLAQSNSAQTLAGREGASPCSYVRSAEGL